MKTITNSCSIPNKPSISVFELDIITERLQMSPFHAKSKEHKKVLDNSKLAYNAENKFYFNFLSESLEFSKRSYTLTVLIYFDVSLGK